jgi:calcium-dependent protein kinase
MTYAAPEVIASQDRKAYTQACDLWSMGVLTYVMLCGKPPFWGTREQHYRSAKNERYPFKGDPWDKMNPDCLDFVRVLLKADPAKRLTMNDCLSHNWLKNPPPENSSQTASVLGNLKNFTAQTTFTRLCITAVARQLDHKHLKDIHQVFKELDSDGNGVLSVDEVRKGIGALGGDVAKVEELFSKMDMDGSKNIDYTEFCAAAMGEKAVSQDEMLWAAFKTFDVDNSGSISVENLRQILDNADVQDQWSAETCKDVGQEIVSRFDSDGDGLICFEDFQKMMSKNWNKAHDETMKAHNILAQVAALDISTL